MFNLISSVMTKLIFVGEIDFSPFRIDEEATDGGAPSGGSKKK